MLLSLELCFYDKICLFGFHSTLKALVSASSFDTYSDQFNVTFLIKDWKEKHALGNLNVTIYDLSRGLTLNCFSNETGYTDNLLLFSGAYIILIQTGNRTVGYERIDIVRSGIYVIKTWAYDLNLTFVDENGKSFSNHTIFLYDQTVFRAPNYVVVGETVMRDANYFVITEEAGKLVEWAKTDEKGRVYFSGVWNGTYKVRIMGVGNETGDFTINLQEPISAILKCFNVNLKLKVISGSGNPIENATVCMRDRLGHLLFKEQINKTGLLERENPYIIEGAYSIIVQYGKRMIGYEVINVTKSGPLTFTIKTWTYNLTIKCIDRDDNPLAGYFVFLYDKLLFYAPNNFTILSDQKGALVSWVKTDEEGIARFRDLWNGTYLLVVLGGRKVGEKVVKLQNQCSEPIIIRCNKTKLTLRFTSLSQEPLPNVKVYLYESETGHLIFVNYTDENGNIVFRNIYADNYTVFAEWMGKEIWMGAINVNEEREFLIRASVYRFSIIAKDPFGNNIPHAHIILKSKTGSHRTSHLNLELETDESGNLSLLLPGGSYEISCSSGIYSGGMVVLLKENMRITVHCNIHLNVWLTVLAIAFPAVISAFYLERRRLKIPLEIRKYKRLLMRLESLYREGAVKHKIYQRLREEYEKKIMELTGRRIR